MFALVNASYRTLLWSDIPTFTAKTAHPRRDVCVYSMHRIEQMKSTIKQSWKEMGMHRRTAKAITTNTRNFVLCGERIPNNTDGSNRLQGTNEKPV